MQEFISQVDRHCKLSDEEKTLLTQTLEILSFSKGDIVISKGKIDNSIYFLREGIWRTYLERDGEEQTVWFAIPEEIVFSTWGYIRGLPCRYSISSLSNSSAIKIENRIIQKLSESSPAFMKWIQGLIMNILIDMDDLMVDLSNPKAEMRYLTVMKKMPEIFHYVPLKEIAGFIGVTPQSLSRIRGGLRKSGTT